jgi:hypothetical protein
MLDDETKQLFEDHVNEHKKELIKEMMYSQQGTTQPLNSEGDMPAEGEEPPPIEEGEVVNA